MLVDLNDAIVHIMQADARVFYDLDKLWGEELRRSLRKTGKTESKLRSTLHADLSCSCWSTDAAMGR